MAREWKNKPKIGQIRELLDRGSTTELQYNSILHLHALEWHETPQKNKKEW